MSDDVLMHVGTKRHSGRYEWGSGEKYRKAQRFLSQVDAYKGQGRSEKEIAESMGISIRSYRSQISIANEAMKEARAAKVSQLQEQGLKASQIAKELGVSVGTVRNDMRVDTAANKKTSIDNVTDNLRDLIESKPYLDVGKGVEVQLGISSERLNAALKQLEAEGYNVASIKVPQVSGAPGQNTTVKVLTKDKDYKNIYKNRDKIEPPDLTVDPDRINGLVKIHYPEALSSKRVKVVYAEEGGTDRDGLMLLRKGADDLDLGSSRYAQVRINVDDKSYLKGMAMYDDNLPKGVDVVFHTNKKKGTPMSKVLKDLKDDPDNPFGATIKRQSGKLNIVNEEGDWYDWSSGFSSQFLSKQPYPVVKERLQATMTKKLKEFDEINALTNPSVKKVLMSKYAEELEGAANTLKAAGYPKTKSHVILPFPDMKTNEVYAPNFKNGDKVILVRHPHGGTFEIPSLTVNNNSPVKKVLGNAKDAIGIHPSQAQKLSGADFDGDTVLVIPNNKGKLKYRDSLTGLKDFEPKDYAVKDIPKDKYTIGKKQQQTKMGMVSNLITDMTIKNAPDSDIVKAVKHSMVVIDSRKHKLDWKQSEIDNNISALQKKYQTHVTKVKLDKFGTQVKKDGKTDWEAKAILYPKDKNGNTKKSVGASTLISLAGKEVDIYDPNSAYTYVDKKLKTPKEKVAYKKVKSVNLIDYVDDAKILSSGSKVENEYAAYVNEVKKLSKKAKNISDGISGIKQNPDARKKYANEAASLNTKLKDALSNKPLERRAQVKANEVLDKKIKSYAKNNPSEPKMDKEDLKRLKSQAIAQARIEVGAARKNINITDKEWEAIQSGAISHSRLLDIMQNVPTEEIKRLATPKPKNNMSQSRVSQAKVLLDRGYTYDEVATQLGVSPSTIMANVTPTKKQSK